MLVAMEDNMQVAEKIREPAQINAVALKAYARVADAWGLSLKEAAGLADMSESTWKRAKKPNFAGELTKDQLLRLSAVIGIHKSLELYFTGPLAKSWFTRPNTGPLFGGSRPVDTAIDGGLPQILGRSDPDHLGVCHNSQNDDDHAADQGGAPPLRPNRLGGIPWPFG